MCKSDAIARKILGWKLNSKDSWYDYENNMFIHDSNFQPEENLDHAMLIVDRLEQFGYSYITTGTLEVHFNDVSGTGNTLAEAITNAAYSIIEMNSVYEADSSRIWHQLC